MIYDLFFSRFIGWYGYEGGEVIEYKLLIWIEWVVVGCIVIFVCIIDDVVCWNFLDEVVLMVFGDDLYLFKRLILNIVFIEEVVEIGL